MPRVITSMSAQIDPSRENELPDGNSGQQPTALSARCRCRGQGGAWCIETTSRDFDANGGPKQRQLWSCWTASVPSTHMQSVFVVELSH
jgi:hypothetical protein